MKARYFDLRAIFDRAERHDIFADGFVVTKWCGAAGEASRRKNILFSERSRKKIASFASIRCSISPSFRSGFSNTFFITRCCIRSCRTRPVRRRPSPRAHRRIQPARTTVPALSARAPLGRRESRAFPALDRPPNASRPSPLSVRTSDGEGVVATFFLIRYQSVVASSREINFARQLFRISFFISTMQAKFRRCACRNVSGVKFRSIRRR